MFELFKAFGGIAVRRLGPEDLPASSFLLGLTAAIYVLLQLPAVLLIFGAGADGLRVLLFDLALLTAAVWALLYFSGYRARFQQTLTAILGTSALLTAISLPFNLWQNTFGDEPGQAAVIPSAVILAIVLWSVVIDGHIVSRALSRSFGVGLIIAIAYFFLHTTLLFEIAPVTE